MILSTQTETLSRRHDDATAIRMIKVAGFDAYDFSMFANLEQAGHPLSGSDYLSYASWLAQISQEAAIRCNQAHAPFPSYKVADPAYNEKIRPLLVRAMEVAATLGAEVIIVHPIALPDPAEQLEINLDLYHYLEPHCQRLGIKVALENMFGYDPVAKQLVANVCSTGPDFVDYLDRFSPDSFTACLDLGHCGLVGADAATMVRELGHERLLSLHVHDNDNISDLHMVPLIGRLDWPKITRALAEIDYQGDLTLEADGFLVNVPTKFLPRSLAYMHEVGRHLISMIKGQ